MLKTARDASHCRDVNNRMEADNSGGVKNRGYVSNSKKPVTTGISGTSWMDNQQQRYYIAKGGIYTPATQRRTATSKMT